MHAGALAPVPQCRVAPAATRPPLPQGAPFCFSAQAGAEAVLAWDLRTPGRCLYELATGNNDVLGLQVR